MHAAAEDSCSRHVSGSQIESSPWGLLQGVLLSRLAHNDGMHDPCYGISQVYHTGRGAACKVIFAKYQARINFTATQETQRKGTGGAAGNRF